MDKLLPCPFCGGEAKITKRYPALLRPSRNGYCVECYECDLQFGHDCDYGGQYATPEEAIEAWNRRVRGMKRYTKGMAEMTDEKAIEYIYGNGYVDLKIADYITKRINGIARHGKWQKVHFCKGTMACSVCGYYFREAQMPHRRYCPNCGAKMDGES